MVTYQRLVQLTVCYHDFVPKLQYVQPNPKFVVVPATVTSSDMAFHNLKIYK